MKQNDNNIEPTLRPLYQSYCGHNGIFAGEYPGDRSEDIARQRVEQMYNFGVRYFIDLTEERENIYPLLGRRRSHRADYGLLHSYPYGESHEDKRPCCPTHLLLRYAQVVLPHHARLPMSGPIHHKFHQSLDI